MILIVLLIRAEEYCPQSSKNESLSVFAMNDDKMKENGAITSFGLSMKREKNNTKKK